ncbi:MAG TPA: hypothetical protein VM554_15190 [Acidisarcina sp.]|nr:hypothetical protein [Acidisarcina sp.]
MDDSRSIQSQSLETPNFGQEMPVRRPGWAATQIALAKLIFAAKDLAERNITRSIGSPDRRVCVECRMVQVWPGCGHYSHCRTGRVLDLVDLVIKQTQSTEPAKGIHPAVESSKKEECEAAGATGASAEGHARPFDPRQVETIQEIVERTLRLHGYSNDRMGAPERCGTLLPVLGSAVRCEKEKGHSGNHRADVSPWPPAFQQTNEIGGGAE